jgi:hypothetical protein
LALSLAGIKDMIVYAVICWAKLDIFWLIYLAQ